MSKTSPAKFIQQVRTEGSKITWPTRQETIQSTIMVLIMAVIASIFLYMVDQVISWSIQAAIEAFA